MRKLKSSILLLFIVFLTGHLDQIKAQCTPPQAETCDESQVLCSLDEMNGYTCNNPSTVPSPCSPLCSMGGSGQNTSWWGFVSQGGNITITLTIGDCNTGMGLQYGVWGDCQCIEDVICRSIPCLPAHTVTVATANLTPCKTYYLWVDGCSGDVCDFTLNTVGGAAPTLSPLGYINNLPSGIISPVCKGACNFPFHVNPQPGGCEPTYVWTLDGNEVGGNSNDIKLDFPDEGDFVICVTAYIGNPQSGSICSQEGPKCATVKVRPIPDKKGVVRTICNEAANAPGFKWHNQLVTATGTYREQFKDPGCCLYDSIVDFIVKPVPDPPDVYFITCNNQPFVDVLGHAYTPCKDHYEVSLPKTTDPYKCDSTFKLTAVNVDFIPRFRVQCVGGQVEISPNISLVKTCNVGETYQFDYRWYKKNDVSKKTITTDERLVVDAVNENYCVEVNVKVDLETAHAICTNTFCETFNEGDLAPKCFPLGGDQILCIGKNGSYFIDTFISQRVNFFTWTIDGGFIVSKPDSQGVEVKWVLPAGDTGTVCVFYDTDCGRSCEKCIRVAIRPTPAPYAGPNDSICNLSNSFQGKKDAGGLWTQIAGPGTSTIKDPTDPVSNVIVDKFGIYRYVYSESRLGCVGTDTVDLYFNSNPDSSGLTYICNTKQTQYKLRFLITGGVAPYTILQGNGTIDANNFYNSNLYDNLTNYTVVVRDVMGCILSFNFNHECKCTNSVNGLDKTPEFKCGDQSIVLNTPTTNLDLNDTLIYVITTDPDPDNAAAGSYIRILNSTTILFDSSYMNYNTTYYVIVIVGKKNGKGGVDFLAGCVQADGPKSFIFYQVPVPNAGADDAICGTLYDLKGKQSVNGSNLKWKLISGNGASITDDTLASTSVNTNGQYGTYVFEMSEDNHNCAVADRVSITFNPSPFVAVDEKICIDYVPPFPYKATIKITNGKKPFTILQGGGSINGNIYTTDTLPSLAQFKVEIQDANGCISNLIIDDYNCNCGNINAGQLDTTLVEVCVDKCVSIKNLLGEITDPEDAVIYVLHQSSYNETDPAFPKIDTFYSVNDLVCFHPNQMVTGHTYYITRVVGDSLINNGRKIVNSKDPCKRVTSNQPIIWYPYPTPDAGPSDSICFYKYQLNGITNSGTPSWKFLSGPGTSNITNTKADVTNVTVNGKGTYLYELTENFKGCITKDTVDITYWDSPKLIDVNPPYECDNTAEHYRVTIDGQNGDRPSWTIDGFDFPKGTLQGSFVGANTWQTDWISNNDTYRLIINDRHYCLPDTVSNTYECPCINALGKLTKTPIVLCINGTAQAKYDASVSSPDGNDVVRYILFDGNPADPKAGTHLSYNANGSFVFDPVTMQAGKTYYIAVILGNPDPNDPNKVLLSDRCLKFDVVPVIWYNYPVSKITGPTLLTCAVTTITLDGNTSTSGSGTPLKFSWSTGNGIIVGATTNGTATINAPGTYKLFVTDTVSQCTHEITYVVTQNVTKPTVGIAPPQLLTCARTSVDLDGTNSSQGPEYKIKWTGPVNGNITNGTSYQPTVDATGIYHLIITNQSNGCVDSFPMNVSSDLKKPIPNIQQLGQLTCTNKQIQLDASNSKGQSGIISSYAWQTNNGDIIAGLGTSKVTIDKPGKYEVTVKDQSNGCDSVTTIDVIEIGNPFLGIDLLAQDPKCFGDRNGNIDIAGVIANGPTNGLQYSFNNGAFGSSTNFSNLSQGTYHLKVKDINGCEHDTTVTLIEPGKLGIQVIKSIVVDQDSLVDLEKLILNISGGTINYKDTAWLNLNQNIKWPTRYNADTTRDFLITVTDAAGCQIQDRVKVIVRIIKDVWWPSAFTPNGDNINDVWNIKGKRVKNIRTLNIYDRWGEMVYSAQNIKDGSVDQVAGWKGVFKGQKALPGVYVFYAEIEYVGSEGFDKYKGDFTLIR